MTDFDALLAAVIAAPDDDGPRLVLADYLIQRGDPRGELIVVQCKLARDGLRADLRAQERADRRVRPMCRDARAAAPATDHAGRPRRPGTHPAARALAAVVSSPDERGGRRDVRRNHRGPRRRRSAAGVREPLIERDDPRGELIALECKLSREPLTLELLARHRELLALRGLPHGMVGVRYERGFVVDASVWFEAVDEARDFLSVEPLLQRLDILACIGLEQQWWALGELIEIMMPRLVYLELQDVEDVLECTEMFARLPPRPTTLELVVPESVPLPAHWRS
jgi:uncharacterized protein (TIGR02996 family)